MDTSSLFLLHFQSPLMTCSHSRTYTQGQFTVYISDFMLFISHYPGSAPSSLPSSSIFCLPSLLYFSLLSYVFNLSVLYLCSPSHSFTSVSSTESTVWRLSSNALWVMALSIGHTSALLHRQQEIYVWVRMNVLTLNKKAIKINVHFKPL